MKNIFINHFFQVHLKKRQQFDTQQFHHKENERRRAASKEIEQWKPPSNRMNFPTVCSQACNSDNLLIYEEKISILN